jgi:hypothetical protein
MNGWNYNWDWWAVVACLLIIAWVLLRPLRDFYVLEWSYFKRVYEDPWRGELPKRGERLDPFIYQCFDNYLAAKAVFDRTELEHMGDDASTEAEQKLFVVPARTKAMATRGAKRKGVLLRLFGGHPVLLHRTPDADIRERRKEIRDDLQALRGANRDPRQVENAAKAMGNDERMGGKPRQKLTVAANVAKLSDL